MLPVLHAPGRTNLFPSLPYQLITTRAPKHHALQGSSLDIACCSAQNKGMCEQNLNLLSPSAASHTSCLSPPLSLFLFSVLLPLSFSRAPSPPPMLTPPSISQQPAHLPPAVTCRRGACCVHAGPTPAPHRTTPLSALLQTPVRPGSGVPGLPVPWCWAGVAAGPAASPHTTTGGGLSWTGGT